FEPPNCKRLQGAAGARRRARRRTFVLQVPDNKTDAVPCERLPISRSDRRSIKIAESEEFAHQLKKYIKSFLDRKLISVLYETMDGHYLQTIDRN
ncbi:MAG: hypothetical protein AB1Z18_04550, partial [Desulfobacterales bacterium]